MFTETHAARRAAASIAGLLLATGVASAQIGPDVIVGDIPEASHYTSGGPVAGKRAYAIGTTSCNIGDERLTWIANNNQHPVISQNMYRLLDGRFEQIGQAWLKHGFCALQGNVCGSCSPNPTGCPALGVGCSDPYSAGLNGSQGGLGPKSEVNAHTGFFPYPWINNGSGDATLRKRLVVNDADINNAGALYFVASMYVQPEDALDDNDNNNESYRRTAFAAGTMNLTLQGTTQREAPAIRAWRDHGLGVNTPDPNVLLTPVDAPGDGRFWVGGKATNLGAGQWRYEYAVQNLTSHRSAQSFSVPLPPGAVVTNVGFKDVDYHSGEPYSLTDWTSSISAGAVSWATQTFAQNQNANALRWDTIYNFRFDCNIPPAGGSTTIGLFRPGTPASIAASTVTPSADGMAHPLNDACANAFPIGNGAFPFSTVNAVTDGPAEPGPCALAGFTQIASDVWYQYLAPCSGTVTVSLCGSTYDTKLAVYGASCPSAPGTALACNDDSNACAAGSLQSQLTFTAAAGASYLIRVGGYQAEQGTGTLTVAGPSCGPVPPANDDCANAIPLADGAPVTGSTQLATNDGSASCGNSSGSPDVWYSYRPATSGNVTIETCAGSTNYDTVLSAHSGLCGSLAQLACNDDACALQSRIVVNMTAGTRYLIRVAGYQGLVGAYTVRVIGGGGQLPPANDDCANRAGIALGATAFTTVGAATDGPAHALCTKFGSNQIFNDVWYNYPAQCTGELTISTCGAANFDSKIAVYDGAGCANLDARLMACNDDDAGCPGNTSTLTVSVVSGQNYTIRVGGYNGASGTGTLTLSCAPPCPVDLNGDGTVTVADFLAFLGLYSDGNLLADFTGDGMVSVADFLAFLSAYSAGC